MTQLLLIFLIVMLVFLLFDKSSKREKNFNRKDYTNTYLDGFKIYLCLKKKIFLYPPKEVCINNKYYTLNLSTNNNLLGHKNINAGGISKNTQFCTECLEHCSLRLYDIIDINITFNDFRKLTNEELKRYLRSVLTSEQYNNLFSEEN